VRASNGAGFGQVERQCEGRPAGDRISGSPLPGFAPPCRVHGHAQFLHKQNAPCSEPAPRVTGQSALSILLDVIP
jgi:hypothetical protein